MSNIICADCLSVLPSLPSSTVDMVLVDPPYGIDFQSHRPPKAVRRAKIANDKTPFVSFVRYLPRLLKPSGCVCVFSRWDVQQVFIDELSDSGLPVRSCVVWDKGSHGMGDTRRTFAPRWESILFAPCSEFRFVGGRPDDVIRCSKVAYQSMVHPNEKPIELLEHLIRACCPVGGTVLDCCMGSGSTGVAAVRTGRDFVGVELDGRHFVTAEKRIAEA